MTYADWIYSSKGLPREGQQIEFLLDFRGVAMKGTYAHQGFHSRWAEYAVDRVRSWRNLAEVFDLATPAQNQAASVLSSAPCLEPSHLLLPLGGLAHAT